MLFSSLLPGVLQESKTDGERIYSNDRFVHYHIFGKSLLQVLQVEH